MACGGRKVDDIGGGVPLITVSIEPLRYITEQIVGNHYRVESFVPDGNSPENYEPTPKQMMRLHQSSLFLMIGELGFERAWREKLEEICRQTMFVKTSSGILHHRNKDQQCHSHHGCGIVDPHVWTSPQNMKLIAQNIFQAVCALDTTHVALYRENLQKLNDDIDRLDKEIHHFTDSIQKRAFLIYHPSLTYFSEEYHLIQLNMEHEGKEPSAKQLSELIATCRQHDVNVIFVQKEFDIQHSRLVANELDAQVVVINPLSYDWKGEMLNIAKTLYAQ